MRYVIVNEERARAAGFKLTGHKRTADGRVLLNEKEVVQSALLSGDMDGRCQQLGGKAEPLDAIRYRTAKNEIIWEQ